MVCGRRTHRDEVPGRRRSGLEQPAIIALVILVAGATMWPLFGPATPVEAHAVVVSTSPPPGALLDRAPSEVSVTFNEVVRERDQSLVVVDAAGRTITGPPESRGTTLAVAIPSDAAGWHAVSWQAVSADGHPISGAWTFRIGKGEDIAPDDLGALAIAGSRPSDLGRWAFLVSQWASALAAVVLAGTMFIMAVSLLATAPRSVCHLAMGAAGASIGLSGLAAATNGPYVSINTAWFSGPDSSDYLIRSLLSATVLLVLVHMTRAAPDRPGAQSRIPVGIGALIAAAALAVPALSGHSTAAGSAASIAVIAHLVVAGCWIGAVPALLLMARDGRVGASDVIAVFSRAAAWLLAGTVIAGGAAVWFLTDGMGNVARTWGWTLFVKISLVGVAVTAAAWNRWNVLPQRSTRSMRELRPALAIEAVALIGIVAASMALTHNGPPRDLPISIAGPMTIDTVVDDDLRVQVTVDPAMVGTNDIHVFVLDLSGVPVDVEEITMVLSADGFDIGDIEVPLSDLGAGHYSTRTSDLGLAGTWQIDLVVRPDRFSQVELSHQLVVSP